jgi:HEAT repeat protein
MDVSQCIDDLNSAEVVQRRQAAEQLAANSDPAAAVSLVRACGDSDEQVREWAVAALEELGVPDAADAAALAELLAAAQGDVRYWSATLLGRLGDRAAAAVGPLILAIDADAESAVRQRAAWAIGRMGRVAAPARESLTRAARGGDARLARLAEEALQNLEGGFLGR